MSKFNTIYIKNIVIYWITTNTMVSIRRWQIYNFYFKNNWFK